MKYSEINTIICSAFFGLIGFLLGNTLSDVSVRVADISSIIVAVAAIYGVLTWQHQYDYQQKKTDTRKIITLIKKSFSYASSLHMSRLTLAENLSTYVKEKDTKKHNAFNVNVVEKSLNRLKNDKESLENTCINIQAEVAVNSITAKDPDIILQVSNLINRTEKMVSSSNNVEMIFESFELLNNEARFDSIKKTADDQFRKFIKEFSEVEKSLDISKSTKAKIESYHHLKESDQADKTPQKVQDSP
jgi:hypothetical protein